MKKLTLLLSILLCSFNSQATLLSIDLNDNNYQIGDVLTADFIISDIEKDSLSFQKLLASFDFSLSWDNTMINYVSSSFGNKLDVDPFLPSDQFTDIANIMSGHLDLTEISYALGFDLFAAQDGLNNFVLARVSFNVIDAGTGSGELGLSNINFGDDLSDALTDVHSNDKAYTVTLGNPINVPEPTALTLMLVGLMLFIRKRSMN